MPARTPALSPNRSASSPAAEQWLAICSTMPRPPVAMITMAWRAGLSADVPKPALRSMNTIAGNPARSTSTARARKSMSSPKSIAASFPYTGHPT
jgi:hypothetical protein